MVFEDQFAATLADATANMRYVGTNYFSRPNYLQANNRPLVLTFGPQKYQAPAQWTQILAALPTPPTFLTLWYQSEEAGANAAGEFNWIYSDFLPGLTNFYQNRVPRLGTAAGVAYPGFDTFYAQGGWGGPTFVIPQNDGQTLTQTLALATQYRDRLAFVQLATFNDFGEGTMLEPTQEFGFSALEQVQTFTGVPYTGAELRLIYRLYTLRKAYATSPRCPGHSRPGLPAAGGPERAGGHRAAQQPGRDHGHPPRQRRPHAPALPQPRRRQRAAAGGGHRAARRHGARV